MSGGRRGWGVCAIGDVAQVVRGVTYGKHDATRVAASGFVPLLRSGNVQDAIVFDDLVHVRADLVKETQYLRRGDIVVSASNSRELVGKSAIVADDFAGTFGAFCMVVRVESGVEPRFLAAVMRAPAFREAMRLASGATNNISNIRKGHLTDYEFPLPPHSVQVAIVSQLERFERGRERAMLDVEAAGRDVVQLRHRLLAEVFEQGWPLTPLGEMLREKPRNGHSAKAAVDGDVRTLTLTAITQRDFSDRNTKLTSANPEKVSDLWLQPGDILIQRSNTPELVGSSALYDGPRGWAIFPDLLIRVRPNEDLYPAFLDLVLQSPPVRRHFRSVARGTSGSMPKISQGMIESLAIPVPTVDEQMAFLRRLRHQLELLDEVQAEVAGAGSLGDALREAVTTAAVSGALSYAPVVDLTDEDSAEEALGTVEIASHSGNRHALEAAS